MKRIIIVVLISVGIILSNSFPSIAIEKGDVASIYISSEDAFNNGRKWVDSSKNNKAEGFMIMVGENGNTIYNDYLKQIKSRGNSTWNDPKKPYQIKLKTATDLCETGIEEEKNTTWILLSNYMDDTLLRNQITLSIANAINLAYTPHCRQVDLYYDGEYRGIYLLCEKTEVGKGRVDIGDLKEEIEKANPDIEVEKQHVIFGRTKNGLQCQFIDSLVMPNRNGGYLLEMDLSDRAYKEKSWFRTDRGQFIVVKSPEYLSYSGMNYISNLYQIMENAVYNGGMDPKSGFYYRDVVDIESLAKVYLIEELSQDVDAFTSSFYFYKPEGEEKLYAGPVWDFDLSYGNKNVSDSPISAYGFGAAKKEFGSMLLRIPSFQKEVKRVYQDQLFNAVKSISEEMREWSSLYADHVSANSEMWPENTTGDGCAEQDDLIQFLLERNDYLYEEIMKWNGSERDFRGHFFDVSSNKWYYEDVKYVDQYNLMNGTGAGIFSPEEKMNRGMVVTVLYRMAGSPDITTNSTFKDIPLGMWFSDAVAWAQQNGISNGVGDNIFNLNDNVKRQDFITMVNRYMGSPFGTGNIDEYLDVASVSGYARNSYKWAIENGIVKGDDTNSLLPINSLSRAEAAAIIHRLMEI